MSAALATAREQTARIARLNDLARRAMGVACTAVATVGFRSLSEADQSQVRELIETFDAFDEDNDPHGERDFGCVYQLGDGQWLSAWSLAGILLGNALYAPIHTRFFRFDSGSCTSD